MLRGKTKNENRNWKVETKSLFRFSPSKIVFFFFSKLGFIFSKLNLLTLFLPLESQVFRT